MMKHLKTCCFLGLALLLLTLPVRSAELPPEVERALPREAGQLLKDVDHWDVNSFPEGLCAIWNHLRKDVNTVLRRQTRGAVSVLLVAVLCGLVSGFQKGVGDESRFLPMAGGLAVTALTAGSLDSLMGAGTAVMEQMNTFSKALLPTLAAVSAISGGAVGATLRQIATVFFADLLLGLIPLAWLAGWAEKRGLLARALPLAGALAIVPVCMGLCRAVPLMRVKKADMAQTVFAEIINREEEPTLLDITSLDQGFYLAAGIVPNCRYFADNNLQTQEKRDAIASYLAEGRTQFVVTRYADPGEAYELIAEADGVFDLNDMRHYKLYKRKEP